MQSNRSTGTNARMLVLSEGRQEADVNNTFHSWYKDFRVRWENNVHYLGGNEGFS